MTDWQIYQQTARQTDLYYCT